MYTAIKEGVIDSMGLFKNKEQTTLYAAAGAIIAAAGASARMNGNDKQYIELNGIPVIARSLLAFENCVAIRDIVLVCREEDMPYMFKLAQDYDISKLRHIVKGGATRQQSVFAGIAVCEPDLLYYAVHDGARPFIDPKLILQSILDAAEHKAVALGVRVKDTVKVVDSDLKVISTPERGSLYITQTPQVFDTSLYRAAMEKAKSDDKDYTDDCQMIEAFGEEVYITQGDYLNIKLTTPDDMILAEAIASVTDNY